MALIRTYIGLTEHGELSLIFYPNFMVPYFLDSGINL